MRRIQAELKLPFAAFFDSLRFAMACRQALGPVDLLYERMGWMGYGGALASRLLNVPLVLEVNGDHYAEFEALGIAPRGAQRMLSMAVTRYAARRAALVVATGEGWRRRFIERWHVDPARVAVVENGSELVDVLARAELRAFQGAVLATPVRLVYVGGFEPWHGIGVLLDAVAQVVAQGTPLNVELIGKGSEEAHIRRRIADLKLADVVELSGYLDASALAQRLAQADIGLSPYCGRVEYSGLKLLDYKAAGLAIIASGAGGEPAVVRHGESGLIVPPCNVDALAAAIGKLAADRQLCQRFGQTARQEAEQLHSWSHTAQELDALFRGLVPAGSSWTARRTEQGT
ncbi:MAG: glycosyltransferase family 4 protein [Caldilineaceae bacterium]|nr:glycosyltransferase family 4 protein [Caldilineaceae bacterium]